MSELVTLEVQKVCWSHVISPVSMEDLGSPVVSGPLRRPLEIPTCWEPLCVPADPARVGLCPWQLTRLIVTGSPLEDLSVFLPNGLAVLIVPCLLFAN